MSGKTLNRLLRSLDPFRRNPPKATRGTIARQIAEDVVWVEQLPKAELHVRRYPQAFYLIKAEDGQTAAIVYVMREAFGWQGDLHAYVSKPYRGRKLLYRPMRETILPHLLMRPFSLGRLLATVDSRHSTLPQAERSMVSLGFIKKSEDENVMVWKLEQNPNPSFCIPEKWCSCSSQQVAESLQDAYCHCLQSIQMLRAFPKVNQKQCKFLEEQTFINYSELCWLSQRREPDVLEPRGKPRSSDTAYVRARCMRSIALLMAAAAAAEMFSQLPWPMEVDPLTLAGDTDIREVVKTLE
jgi:hypothetical protein